MSGGHFEYRNQSARFEIEQALEVDILGLENRPDLDDEQKAQLEIALKLKPAAELFFQMLKEYDYAASGDSSFAGAIEEFNVKRVELVKALGGGE